SRSMIWPAPAGLALLLAALLAMPTPAPAQSADVQTLTQRIERLQRDLRTLEKDYYRGQKRGAAKRGTADRGAGTPTSGQLANAEIRMSNLESEMRRLTGQLEEVRHGIQTLLQRLDGLVRDVDFRLTELEHRRSGGPQAKAAPGAAPQSGGATGEGKEDYASAKAAAAEPSAVLPEGTTAERYNYAYSMLLNVRLGEAEVAFQEFLAQHADDALAGNAQYWLGETYYTQNKLTEAAQTFLTGLQRYPNSSKAPDSMLKLGITLGKMGQREEACATFSEMAKLFTSLRPQVRKRMRQEISAGGCG
ncbi:MAG: tol-pal system protein YbgF, partial [Alphaproteobacteria bacterium]|nr:tol-pal system protein YbgF [Alphaproteobacteria bacterium]